ncbi:MAG: hypothetical protein ABR575_05900, partial [Actinomycetota bacterium]
MLVALLGHAALGLVALAGFRGRLALGPRTLAATGMALAGALFLVRGPDAAWRGATLDPHAAALAAVAIGCGWLVFWRASVDLGRDAFIVAALVGAASSGLALFAATDWVVPALLFWGCNSAALVVLAGRAGARWATWPLVAASDLALAGGALVAQHASGAWTFPGAPEGAAAWLLGAAVALRSGALPRVGPWGLVHGASAPGVPLAIGGAFLLAVRAGLGARPWVAAGAIALSVALAVWGA